MKSIIFYILAALMAMSTLTACGILPHEVSTSLKPAKVQEPIDPLKQPGQGKALAAQQQARQLLEEQDYVATINLIQNEIRQGVEEQALAEEYLQAANGSLGQADRLIDQGHYSKAALFLMTVQESYPKSLERQKQMSASPVQITKKIDLCTEELMEAGLVAYRSGDFGAAIDVWTQVLEFNPQHKAAQDSIQTTQLQLANLKTLDTKK